MAYSRVRETEIKEQGANLTGKLFHFVKLDSNGRVVLAGAGELIYGVIVEEPKGTAVGKYVTVQTEGIAKVEANGNIASGALVASDGNGKAVTASGAGTRTAGINESPSAVDGDIISLNLDRDILHA